jgi:hypothetical protein
MKHIQIFEFFNSDVSMQVMILRMLLVGLLKITE